MNDIYQEVMKNLRSKYKKQTLSIQETAHEMGVSTSTLRGGIREGKQVPDYKIIGYGEIRKKVVFPIHSVAKFLSDTQRVF